MTLLCTQTRVTTPGTTLSGTITPGGDPRRERTRSPSLLQRAGHTKGGKKCVEEEDRVYHFSTVRRWRRCGKRPISITCDSTSIDIPRGNNERPSHFDVCDDDPPNVKIAVVIRARLSINVRNNGRRSREQKEHEGTEGFVIRGLKRVETKRNDISLMTVVKEESRRIKR